MLQQNQVWVCCDTKAEVGSHIIFLYQAKSELLDVLSDYFIEGLKNNNACLMVIPSDNLADEINGEIGRKDILNKEQLKEKLVFIKHKKFYFSNGKFDPNKVFEMIDKQLDKNISMIRSAGDCSWVDKAIFNDFYQYEVALTERYNSKNILLLCAYFSKQLEIEQIIKLIQSHMLILFKEGASWKISETVERKIYDQKIEELEKFTKFAVGRELKMTELKKKIEQLEKELSRYKRTSE